MNKFITISLSIFSFLVFAGTISYFTFLDKSELKNQIELPIPAKIAQTKDTLELVLTPKSNYQTIRNRILVQRQLFRQQFYAAKTPAQQQAVLDTAGKYLSEVLVNQLIPHWYGTPWAFEGYTDVPKQGSVACGYFVSTLLTHAGLNLNRYKIAQQNPECEVLTLHQQPRFIIFQADSVSYIADSVRMKLKEGLYIFGKENHVGFMLHRHQKVYLIHSNYTYSSRYVMAEWLTDSQILNNPPYIFFGEISTNSKLIRQWLDFKPVTVILPENIR